jgi:S-adenosylmethionine synthetase
MTMNLIVREFDSAPPRAQPVEVVERKGLGHPDTICDGVAENVCVRLCRYYLDHFGVILHHNVDKVLLCGGSAKPSFRGGKVVHPIEIYLSGRATEEYRGHRIPVHEIAEAACREWLQMHVPTASLEKHVRMISRIRPGSSDLVHLFAAAPEMALSNDTSCGAGFAPLSDLENIVLDVERVLNSAETKRIHPAIGVDIKVMGVRDSSRIKLTVSCAFLDRFIGGIDEYLGYKDVVQRLSREAAQRRTRLDVECIVNAADDIQKQNIFLTVTGTSAEAGDDGEVGRGNRTCGLITPYRAMTIEAAAGKNPVTHVGKLYSLLARLIAEDAVSQIAGVTDAQCLLVSQIGCAITEPQLVDVRLLCAEGAKPNIHDQSVKQLVDSRLKRIAEIRDAVLSGKIRLY